MLLAGGDFKLYFKGLQESMHLQFKELQPFYAHYLHLQGLKNNLKTEKHSKMFRGGHIQNSVLTMTVTV